MDAQATGLEQMEITINGQSTPVDVEGLVTFKDLVDYLEREHIGFPNVITRMVLNEEEIDEGQEVGFGSFPIEEIASLSLLVADRLELAYEALNDSQIYLPELSAILEQSAKVIREGDIKTGLQNASEALEYISQFGEVLNGIRAVFHIDFAQVRIDDLTLLDKLLELNKFASEVLKAIHDENWTLFADLIEYEISPLLYEWMAVIPEIVNLLPDRLPDDGDAIGD